MNEASKIILATHSTEKLFPMVETEGKICFIVERSATKKQIAEAIKLLYEIDAISVNTARTPVGKKAFVKFKDAETARELAADMGIL